MLRILESRSSRARCTTSNQKQMIFPVQNPGVKEFQTVYMSEVFSDIVHTFFDALVKCISKRTHGVAGLGSEFIGNA